MKLLLLLQLVLLQLVLLLSFTALHASEDQKWTLAPDSDYKMSHQATWYLSTRLDGVAMYIKMRTKSECEIIRDHLKPTLRGSDVAYCVDIYPVIEKRK